MINRLRKLISELGLELSSKIDTIASKLDKRISAIENKFDDLGNQVSSNYDLAFKLENKISLIELENKQLRDKFDNLAKRDEVCDAKKIDSLEELIEERTDS